MFRGFARLRFLLTLYIFSPSPSPSPSHSFSFSFSFSFTSKASQFLSAQRITFPLVTSGLFALFFNLALGLLLVLGIPVPGWSGLGFWACPFVTSGVEWAELFLLVGVYFTIMRLHEKCWPEDGWSWKHITRERVVEFASMYVQDDV